MLDPLHPYLRTASAGHIKLMIEYPCVYRSNLNTVIIGEGLLLQDSCREVGYLILIKALRLTLIREHLVQLLLTLITSAVLTCYCLDYCLDACSCSNLLYGIT